MIHVINTGCGIPPDKLETVFEPFVQVDSSTTRPADMGLGLSISRQLARDMRGDLTATSAAGEGCTSVLTLALLRRADPARCGQNPLDLPLHCEHLYRRALVIDRKLHGEVHPKVATVLDNLAQVLRDRGDYVESERLYRQALEILRPAFPEGHLRTAAALTGLGRVLVGEGRTVALPLTPTPDVPDVSSLSPLVHLSITILSPVAPPFAGVQPAGGSVGRASTG